MIGQETPDDVSRSKMKRSNVTARYRAWPVGRVARVGRSRSRSRRSQEGKEEAHLHLKTSLNLNMDQSWSADMKEQKS